MKNIVILGSTGSIGENTLDVIRNSKGRFRVLGLSACSNAKKLYDQIREFRPRMVCVTEPQAAAFLKKKCSSGIKIYLGEDGLRQLCRDKRTDKVVMAITGSGALVPLIEAIEHKKDIALANKEALVMAGSFIRQKARSNNARIIPVDSEQSAIWQCCVHEDMNKLKNVYLTASGGPLRKCCKKALKNISIKQVLKHPRWKMGRKITVDSATLMNKGFELLETMYLFDVNPEKIHILIHPEAIIHSMVEYIDGVIIAQLSVTDMRIPIQYALTFPERLKNSLAGIDFFKLKSLNFEKPDFRKFPALRLAYQVARSGGTAPCVLNAANEISVGEFFNKRLNFISIVSVVEKVLQRHRVISPRNIKDIMDADSWARDEARRLIAGGRYN